MSIIFKFVFGQPPAVHPQPDFFRNPGIIGEKIKIALLILLMLSHDLISLFIGTIRVVIIHPYIISAEWTVIIGIRFGIRNGIKFPKYMPGPHLQGS